MSDFAQLYAEHPFWIWLAVGALLLAAEAATGSGWLLWPAASAGVVAVITLLGLHLGAPTEVGIFAALTLVTTFVARRYLVHAPKNHPDINDPNLRLVGKKGQATSAFVEGHGRAFVGNAEWLADLDGDGELAAGAPIIVTAIEGSRLKVKPT
jgi:membrane protein implicated in regulation of membrane protease activity